VSARSVSRRYSLRACMIAGLLLPPLLVARVAEAAPRPATHPRVGAGVRSTPELLARAAARGELDSSTAKLYLAYALAEPARLPRAFRSPAPWRGTLPLLNLRSSIRRDPGDPALATAAEVLDATSGPGAGARATRSGPPTCSLSTERLPDSVKSDHFRIQYDGSKLGGRLTIDDYVIALEHSWTAQVATFGWAAPPARASANGLYHVRIDRLFSGLYGYVDRYGTYAGIVGDNPNTLWTEPDAAASCMVLNQNYSGFASPPLQSLQATVAHEFNHSIQFGYGDLTGANRPDDVFVEGGATWMEDEVFDGSNDNQYYLWPRFIQSMGSYSASPYPYWVVLRGLVERLGHATDGTGSEQAMQDFWESISRGEAIDLGAFREALALHGIDLASAYADWALAVKFSRPCDAAYLPPFCIEQGNEYADAAGRPRAQLHVDAVGRSVTGSIPDNYSLSWVRLPKDGGPFTVRVRNTSGGGALRARIACDLGPGLGLRVYDVGPGTLPGGAHAATAVDPAGCTSSLVAVIANVRQSNDDPAKSIGRSFRVTIPG
jgi:hypothetical protein